VRFGNLPIYCLVGFVCQNVGRIPAALNEGQNIPLYLIYEFKIKINSPLDRFRKYITERTPLLPLCCFEQKKKKKKERKGRTGNAEGRGRHSIYAL
jgi:hypothetical protein